MFRKTNDCKQANASPICLTTITEYAHYDTYVKISVGLALIEKQGVFHN